VARGLIALAAVALVVTGCTSQASQSSAQRSTSAGSSATSSGASSSAAPGGAGDTSSGSSAPSGQAVPSIAPNGAVSQTVFTQAGSVWPLTIKDGSLACDAGTQVLFKTSDGTVYGVNSAAIASGEWADINVIRADDPKHPGSKLSLDSLIAAGQQLC
jgi:Protein of unknown function (DUF2511)